MVCFEGVCESEGKDEYEGESKGRGEGKGEGECGYECEGKTVDMRAKVMVW